ncbi:MAG: Crp/Fnr family transcriptional regulator [Bacteroidetes bacterium]|nr:Crp/Fnr family transcriptional regulator [Bacteroidales bacterium]MBU1009478.1 Crp/Fnr family transcriptional regulator [Bacteroidota bacterium]
MFSLLSKEELVLLNKDRFEVTFHPGETIIKQGTSANHFVSLTSGMAKLFLEGLDRKNLILEIVKPWKLFGGPGIFTDLRYHYSVTAISETSACFIAIDNVKKLIKSNPAFTESLLIHCSLNNSRNFERLLSLTHKQMPGRLADVLLYLSKDVYRSMAFNLSITRQEIGDLSNMTKESATRIMKDFENEGIISIDGKIIEILKLDTLKEISLRG